MPELYEAQVQDLLLVASFSAMCMQEKFTTHVITMSAKTVIINTSITHP